MPQIDYKLAETQQKFSDFYQKNLQSIYAQLEPERHKYLHRFYKVAVIGTSVIFLLYLLCHYDFISSKIYTSEAFVKIAAFALVVFAVLLYMPFYDYRTVTKSRVMKKILSFWGDFKYIHENNIIGTDLIKKSELFALFNHEEIDDAFSGRYKKSNIKVSEHCLKIQGRKGDTKIFKGIFILLDFSKKFNGKTVLLGKGRRFNLLLNNPLLSAVFAIPMALVLTIAYKMPFDFGLSEKFFLVLLPLLPFLITGLIIYITIRRSPKNKAVKKVFLEDLPFLKHWKVMTDDQVEARYILTPVFMEKIMELKKIFHGNIIDCSFFDNKLLIAIHTRKNLFETTSLFVPALSYHKVREVISQLHSIFTVIDLLDAR